MPNPRSDPQATAVLVIDLARDFVEPGGTIADAGGPEYQARARAIVPAVARLIEAARRAGATVVYSTDCHRAGDAELAKWPPHAMDGTRWAEILPEIAPQPGDLVLPKSTYSGFQSSPLEAELRARGISRLVIAGLHTDCCCRHTSGDAFQKGFDLVWATDAMQAFTEEAHRAGLDYFRTWYATDPTRQFRTVAELAEEWASAPAVADSAA